MPDNSVFERVFNKTFLNTGRTETVTRKKDGVSYPLKAIVTRMKGEEEPRENGLFFVKSATITVSNNENPYVGSHNPSYNEVFHFDDEDYDVTGFKEDGVSSVKYYVERVKLVQARLL